MRRHLIHIVILLLLSCSLALAGDYKTVHLNSGQAVAGEVLFENEDVVILKAADGSRYQFQRTEIESIADGIEPEKVEEKKNDTPERKVSLQLQLSGGAANLPGQFWAGAAEGLVAVGANNLLQRGIFLGGAAGYEAVIHGKRVYSFIPIAIVTQVPFLAKTSSPFIGAGMGYGIATSKSYKGGLYASLDLGWRWRTGNNGTIAVALHTAFQQTRLNLAETYNNQQYTNNTGRCFVAAGAKLIVGL